MTEEHQQLTVLSPNWIAYCAEFARTLNMQKARDASGISVNAVKQHSNDLLVQQEILKNMTQINTVANVDKGMVLAKLYDFTESDIVDIYYDDGSFKPLREWPKVMRQMLVSFELCNLTGRPIKVKFIDKLKVIALLGKHVDVGAFEEKITVQHDFSDRLAERLNNARGRTGRNEKVINHE